MLSGLKQELYQYMVKKDKNFFINQGVLNLFNNLEAGENLWVDAEIKKFKRKLEEYGYYKGTFMHNSATTDIIKNFGLERTHRFSYITYDHKTLEHTCKYRIKLENSCANDNLIIT